MPRIVKEYAVRRSEILDVTLRLVYTKGYEQMTIQDILDALQISKGALYHYFDSKAAVLEALVERMVVEQVEPMVIPIVDDPRLTALEKLQCYVNTAGRWKVTKKDLMLELVKVWYSDENLIVRQKMFNLSAERLLPLVIKIIRQGAKEGVFTIAYPEFATQVFFYLIQAVGDSFIKLMIDNESGQDVLQQARGLVDAYNDAMERILGAPKGSIDLLENDMLLEWFSPPGENMDGRENSPAGGERSLEVPNP